MGCLLHESPKFHNTVFLFVGLTTLGTLMIFCIGWFFNFGVQTFQPLILIYRSGNFVYHHWGCILYINLSAIELSLKIPVFFFI